MKEWHEKLKELRDSRNLKQEQLAAQAKISQGMISGLENNKKKFTQPTLDKILHVLNYSYRDVFCERTKEEMALELRALEIKLKILELEKDNDRDIKKGMLSATPKEPAGRTGLKRKAG